MFYPEKKLSLRANKFNLFMPTRHNKLTKPMGLIYWTHTTKIFLIKQVSQCSVALKPNVLYPCDPGIKCL